VLNCKQVTETAEEYLDENIPFRKKMAIKLHLMMCVHCRRYIDQYQITKGVIQKMMQSKPLNLDHRPAWKRIQKIREQDE